MASCEAERAALAMPRTDQLARDIKNQIIGELLFGGEKAFSKKIIYLKILAFLIRYLQKSICVRKHYSQLGDNIYWFRKFNESGEC